MIHLKAEPLTLYCKSSDFPDTKHTARLLLLSGYIDAERKPLASRQHVTQQLHQQMHKNVSARDVRDLSRSKLERNSDWSTVQSVRRFCLAACSRLKQSFSHH